MKTLVNKNNPNIKIIVPEIDHVYLPTGDNVFIVKQWPLNALVFFDTDWELIDSLSQFSAISENTAKLIAWSLCRDLPPGEEKDSIVYYTILGVLAGAQWVRGSLETIEKGRSDGQHIVEGINNNLKKNTED